LSLYSWIDSQGHCSENPNPGEVFLENTRATRRQLRFFSHTQTVLAHATKSQRETRRTPGAPEKSVRRRNQPSRITIDSVHSANSGPITSEQTKVTQHKRPSLVRSRGEEVFRQRTSAAARVWFFRQEKGRSIDRSIIRVRVFCFCSSSHLLKKPSNYANHIFGYICNFFYPWAYSVISLRRS